MFPLNTRARCRPLAYFIPVLTATAILGACSDETTAPAPNARSRAMRTEALAPSPYDTRVDLSILDKRVTFNTMTGYASVRAAVSCTAYETFDVILEMHQNQRDGSGSSTVSGSTTFAGVTCTDGSASFTLLIAPQTGEFVTGNATVTARIANYQPWVEPTEVRRKVQVTAQ